MAVTANQVKELREMTGVGMMDCKKALEETAGDMEAAIDCRRQLPRNPRRNIEQTRRSFHRLPDNQRRNALFLERQSSAYGKKCYNA